MKERERVRRWDRHLEGVALAAGFDSSRYVLITCWQGSVVWNVLLVHLHRPRVLLADGKDAVLLGYGLGSAGHEIGRIRRDEVRITFSHKDRLLRLSAQMAGRRRRIKLQVDGAAYCQRLRDWLDE